MAKRSVDEILDGSLPEKSAFISLEKLSNYYYSRSFVARKIKYLEFISGNKVALFSRLTYSYEYTIYSCEKIFIYCCMRD